MWLWVCPGTEEGQGSQMSTTGLSLSTTEGHDSYDTKMSQQQRLKESDQRTNLSTVKGSQSKKKKKMKLQSVSRNCGPTKVAPWMCPINDSTV